MTASPHRGRFITLEGIDGAGKSTHAAWLADALTARGDRVVATREPGGTPVGEALREMLLRRTMAHETEALLVFAARREHVVQVIEPALARGDVVLCDRFTDATYAYQGGGHGVSMELIAALERMLHGHCNPDLTLLFDVPGAVSRERLDRMRAKGRELDKFECEAMAFFERVRNVYLEPGGGRSRALSRHRCDATARRGARGPAADRGRSMSGAEPPQGANSAPLGQRSGRIGQMSRERGDHASALLSPLPWQAALAAELVSRRQRWPHAMLVTGPAGIGKRVLAEWLARTLVCETPRDDGSPCGACPGCRYAAAGQHPDWRIVEPIEIEDDEVKAVEWISVDRIRALTRWAELTSHRGGAKVALIVPAERMNPPAANALLKTLEEPPANTFYILVSHQPGRLPATVRSRCQRIVAPRPTRAEGLAWMAAQGCGDPGRALAQADGAPLAAMALADADYQAERSVWMKALAAPSKLAPGALGARVEAGPREARKDRLAAAIDWLAAWCADLARVRAGGTPVQNPRVRGRARDARAISGSRRAVSLSSKPASPARAGGAPVAAATRRGGPSDRLPSPVRYMTAEKMPGQ